MNITFKGHDLIIGESTVTFILPVMQVIESANSVIVRLEAILGRDDRNIYSVRYDGSLKWQVEPFVKDDPSSSHCPWAGIDIVDSKLIGYNWLGYTCKIDLETGKILEKLFTK
jgi:hypothetical protein